MATKTKSTATKTASKSKRSSKNAPKVRAAAAHSTETSESSVTTDHDEIQDWVEARGGRPATVTRTASGEEAGILRIDFPGYSGEDTLEEISWDEFFEKFEEKRLAFLYQDETADGNQSRFNKFISRESA